MLFHRNSYIQNQMTKENVPFDMLKWYRRGIIPAAVEWILMFVNTTEDAKMWWNISDTLACGSCITFLVFTTFWSHLWSITEQTQGNMISISQTETIYQLPTFRDNLG